MVRVACLVAVVLVLAGCGTERKETPAPSVPASVAPASEAPEPPDNDGPDTEPPASAPGDLSDQGQAYLDEAIGTELGALEAAPPDQAAAHRKTLDNLPGEPDKVLAALSGYQWLSPEAEALYRKAQNSR
ncbi:hypothetical protein [Actinoplanes sp. NPDC049265]|uniref:hypothetical protein n=1 Tax=Actinoplanes sp. NPDC049265 TaxID=3363902 RepID=UPI00371A2FF8